MGQRFGQHFLKDDAILDNILRVFNPAGPIIEIGPGRGALTFRLLALNVPLWVIEIDPELQEFWKNQQVHYPQLTVVCADVLALDWMEWATWHQGPFEIISNLPYEISGPFLVRLAQHAQLWSQTVLLLQKEIVEKVVAPISTHAYGRLSVQVQRHCVYKPGRTVPPGAFQPPPKVMSQILQLKPRQDVPEVPCVTWENMLRVAFCHRRQMLRRIFKKWDVDWEKLGILPTHRPENITVGEWTLLAHALEALHFTQ